MPASARSVRLRLLLIATAASAGCSGADARPERKPAAHRVAGEAAGSPAAAARPHDDTHRVPVVRSDSAGVEIASIQKLPSLLDERFRWRVRVVSTIPTEPVPGQPM